MSDSVDDYVGEVLNQLWMAGSPERAESEQRYLKLTRPFIGVDVPSTRRIVKQRFGALGDPDERFVRAAVDGLWEFAEFDARRAGVETAVHAATLGLLGIDDLDWIRPLIADAETWALVDPLAIGVAGTIADVDRSAAVDVVLDGWSTSPVMWVRRSSMLATIPSLRRDLGRWDQFCGYADQMMDERDFFIRKAIGWVLRDTGRRQPDLVAEWVAPRLDQMSGVTRREAVKYLPNITG